MPASEERVAKVEAVVYVAVWPKIEGKLFNRVIFKLKLSKYNKFQK